MHHADQQVLQVSFYCFSDQIQAFGEHFSTVKQLHQIEKKLYQNVLLYKVINMHKLSGIIKHIMVEHYLISSTAG